MAANEKDMLVKADHVKVYFKGKNKRYGKGCGRYQF